MHRGRDRRSASPVKLPFAQVEPTTRCNFTCGFCAGRHMPQQDMPMGAFHAFIDQAEGLEHVELQGEGEPLLHPQFFDMIGYARKKFPRLKVSTITNGSLLTAGNIDRLLEHGVTRIFVSMESADNESFQRIRGGKLERVRRGIAKLLAERDARGMGLPVVGLAVTVLKTTVREASRGISDFYRDLRLDGGIVVQRLQAMPGYSKLYGEETRAEMPDDGDMRRLHDDIRGNAPFVAALRKRQEAPGFYEALYASVDPGAQCPWLENALYVSAQGDFVACCHHKNYAEQKLGDVRSGVEGAIRRRMAMGAQVREGRMPSACTGCPIANNIARNALIRAPGGSAVIRSPIARE